MKFQCEILEWIWSENPSRELDTIAAQGHWVDFEGKRIGEREGLKRLGDAGWELVTVIPREKNLGWLGRTLYFKRNLRAFD